MVIYEFKSYCNLKGILYIIPSYVKGINNAIKQKHKERKTDVLLALRVLLIDRFVKPC